MTGRIESTILRCLLFDEEFARKTLPFIHEDYFEVKAEKLLFSTIRDFVQKYNTLPTTEAVTIVLSNVKGLAQDDFQTATNCLGEYLAEKFEKPHPEWLLQEVERFCQDRAICIAVLAAVGIVTGEDKVLDKGALPGLLTKALAVSFDPHIGHNYFEDAGARYDYYHRAEQKLPFDIQWFNMATNGGIPAKTLNVVLAGTHVGKTLIMCHFASGYLKLGKNVLYITLEVSEEEITKRIDANLLNIAMDDLNSDAKTPRTVFQEKIDKLRQSTAGTLIVKEYPTAAAHAGHFRNLLNELRLKKNFVPDVIFVDYLNICSSSRLKQGPTINSYTFVKAIGEELRGLGVEYVVPIFTATQTNRAGFGSSDVGMEDTSESFGLPMTADFMFAAINTDDLEKLGQYVIKILKCRYAYSQNKKFVVGVDRAKMRLYDIEQSGQDLVDAGPQDQPEGDGTGILEGMSSPKSSSKPKLPVKTAAHPGSGSLWGDKFAKKKAAQKNFKNLKV